MKWAFETLERYRKRFCMFNDDVQVNCNQIHFNNLSNSTLKKMFFKVNLELLMFDAWL